MLRLFAFLCVFLHHALPGFDPAHHAKKFQTAAHLFNVAKQAGGFGVCLFFLLSAYLITELLHREQLRTGVIHVRAFYVRRILRIWPLYFVFLFACVFFARFCPDYRIEGERLIAFIFLSGNWYVGVAGCGTSPIAPLWSISVEEQFYLLWPWVAKLRKGAHLWKISLLLLPISWIAIIVLSRDSLRAGRLAWVNSFVQFQFFATGTLLALALRRRAPEMRLGLRMFCFVGGLLSWFVAAGVLRIKDDVALTSTGELLFGYMLIGIGCVLLFLAFLGISSRFVPGQLAYLGKISYGLYVFHMAALDLMRNVVIAKESALTAAIPSMAARYIILETTALGITTLLAYFSYRVLEQPFLKIKDRFAFVVSRRI